MRQEDLELLEPLRVPQALMQHLGRLVRPGELRVTDRASALIQQGQDEAMLLLKKAQAMLEAEREARSAQHAAEFADLLLRQSEKIGAIEAQLQARLAGQITPGVSDALRRLGLTLPPADAVNAAARALVAQFSHLDQPVLQVCPEDLAAAEAAGGVPRPSGWGLESDAALPPGTCRLRTDQGSVSCSFPALLAQIADWLEANAAPAPAPDPPGGQDGQAALDVQDMDTPTPDLSEEDSDDPDDPEND